MVPNIQHLLWSRPLILLTLMNNLSGNIIIPLVLQVRKLRCEKLGNLSKGTSLARDSAWFKPSVLTPEFIPFNCYTGVAESSTTAKKLMVSHVKISSFLVTNIGNWFSVR